MLGAAKVGPAAGGGAPSNFTTEKSPMLQDVGERSHDYLSCVGRPHCQAHFACARASLRRFNCRTRVVEAMVEITRELAERVVKLSGGLLASKWIRFAWPLPLVVDEEIEGVHGTARCERKLMV